jgi:hypothetical protein
VLEDERAVDALAALTAATVPDGVREHDEHARTV